MRRLLLLAWLVAVPASAAETMRIAVGGEVERVVVEGAGLQWGEDADDASWERLGHRRVAVTLDAGHLALDGRALVQDAVRFRAGEQEDLPITVNGLAVRGDVVVLRGRTALAVVNVLGLEDYLIGVLGSEMPKTFPLEALKAQAVAARTYALNKKLEQYGAPFHLGSSVISQVYGGLDAEHERTREAVEATRGLVLTWQLQPIEAYFHSSCGGRTESGADALSRDLPYLRPVDCPCGRLASTRWSLRLGPRELARLGGRGELEVLSRTATGRVRRVDLAGRGWDAVTLREKVGYARLKSLAFEVSNDREGVLLQGTGFGHGAGLCQWGARMLADRGWDFRRILGHYYPGTELQTLY